LATLPTHDTQALQFYNIMDMLLNYSLDANTESNLMGLAANQNDRYIATLAESALSIYFGHRFVRRAAPVDLTGSNKKALDSNWLSEVFQLQPNPANNQINVFLPNQHLDRQALKMSIYDTYGNHWKTVEIPEKQLQLTVDLEALPTGMYFCRLYTNEQTLGMQKLMIVK